MPIINTCGVCGHEWDEAVEPTPAGRCPREHEHKDDTERKTVGEILKTESDALSSAMMGLANSDTYFENDEERFESAEDYFLAVCHVREAVEKLEEAARKFLRDAEEGLPE